MDIHILIQKIGINGQLLTHNNYHVPVPVHRLQDCSHDLKLPEIASTGPPENNSENVGEHRLITGGEHASFIMLPVLKP